MKARHWAEPPEAADLIRAGIERANGSQVSRHSKGARRSSHETYPAGAPGAGKGVQAVHLVEKHRIAHLSTGEILRAEAAAGTPFGLEVRDIMRKGELVPDDVMLVIVLERIARPENGDGFVLDGFPRTIAQAGALERALAEKNLELDAAIELKVDNAVLLDRVRERAAASGGAVRADDTAETLQRRLEVYHAETIPLLRFYAERGLLNTVDGMAPIETVAQLIDERIGTIRA